MSLLSFSLQSRWALRSSSGFTLSLCIPGKLGIVPWLENLGKIRVME